MKDIRKRLATVYDNLKRKYPSSFEIYESYKNENSDYHAAHKISSALYLLRLVIRECVGRAFCNVSPPTAESLDGRFLNGCEYEFKDHTLTDRKSVGELASFLEKYDVISFDVFDTLIFRPFYKPQDLFYALGTRLGYFNFKEIRMLAERDARRNGKGRDNEVTIYDIYRELAKKSNIKVADAEREIALEEEMCYANPYMLSLFHTLLAYNKKIIVVSDMYLPSSVLERILYKNGFRGYKALYVSCDYGCNKASGRLFKYVKRDFGDNVIHIGDNLNADIGGARRAGLSSYYYKRCCELGHLPETMISPFGSLYKGVVCNCLYSGFCDMNERERFAFSYAGPVAAGFCDWINRFCHERDVQRIFFLARDMKSIHKIYNKHYRRLENKYVIASRFALQELIISDYPEEYFYHTVRARCDKGYTLSRTFRELGLESFIYRFAERSVRSSDEITSSNIDEIKEIFIENKDEIADSFSENELAAKKYFSDMLGGARRICIADLGWRGSIIAYLKFLLVDRWRMCDEVCGTLIASTVNDSSVEFISDGTITPYIYSHAHNRDFLNLYDWDKEFIRIMTLEAVFTSSERSLIEYKSTADGGYEFAFGAPNRNAPIVEDFRRGMERFSDELDRACGKHRDIFPMSAADAFTPMHSILENYEYIAKIIGDVTDTPYALPGLGISERDYVPLGELLAQRNLIRNWHTEKN